MSSSSTPGLIPSALDARTQAFPVLTASQINRIRPMGRVRKVQQGEILFQPGDTDVPFFVLLSGRIEVMQPDLRASAPLEPTARASLQVR